MNHVSLKSTTDPDQVTTRSAAVPSGADRPRVLPDRASPTRGRLRHPAENIVQGCGYTSARARGGLDVAGDGPVPLRRDAAAHRPLRTTHPLRPAHGHAANVPPLTLPHAGRGQRRRPARRRMGASSSSTTSARRAGPGQLQLLHQRLGPDRAHHAQRAPGLAPEHRAAGRRTGAHRRTDRLPGHRRPGHLSHRTTSSCNAPPCRSDMYAGSVDGRLQATDPGGSGVAATYYTTDGSTPTSSSPKSGPVHDQQQPTFNFFSVDNAGNAEQVRRSRSWPHLAPIRSSAPPVTSPATRTGSPSTPAPGTATDCRAVHPRSCSKGSTRSCRSATTSTAVAGPARSRSPTTRRGACLKPITHPVPGDTDYASTGAPAVRRRRAPATTGISAPRRETRPGLLQLRPRPLARRRDQHRTVRGQRERRARLVRHRSSGCGRTSRRTPRPAPLPTTRTRGSPRPPVAGTTTCSRSGRTCTTAA